MMVDPKGTPRDRISKPYASELAGPPLSPCDRRRRARRKNFDWPTILRRSRGAMVWLSRPQDKVTRREGTIRDAGYDGWGRFLRDLFGWTPRPEAPMKIRTVWVEVAPRGGKAEAPSRTVGITSRIQLRRNLQRTCLYVPISTLLCGADGSELEGPVAAGTSQTEGHLRERAGWRPIAIARGMGNARIRTSSVSWSCAD